MSLPPHTDEEYQKNQKNKSYFLNMNNTFIALLTYTDLHK